MKSKLTFFTILLFTLTLMFNANAGKTKDQDVNTYKTVKFGNQVWMVENLNVSHFRNGDPILEVKTNEEWTKAGIEGKPVWCYYDNDPANGKKFGKLYNWFAVNDPRGLAPAGWHIPSDGEWTQLANHIGGKSVAGGKMKSKGTIQAGTGLYKYPNTDATNESGFTGLPGGYRHYTGEFHDVGDAGYWWTSEQYNTYYAWYRQLHYYYGMISRSYFKKRYGFSVRCLGN